jgi:curved DNA-binding protein
LEFKDYYELLGVNRDASADEIKKAYRKLARKYHPDISKEKDAESRMKKLNEAFAVLSDVEKRAAYDKVGQGLHAGEEFRPPPNWDTGFEFSGRQFSDAEAAEFSDFFSEIFGSRMGRRAAHGQARSQARGEDHHAKIELDLEDAYHGITRKIALQAPQIDEQGRVHLVQRSLDVRIPKGVREGQLIRLSGQGSQGSGGGQAGDLYLEIHFKTHSRYRVEGRDVYASLPVAPWEAALGATVEVQVPDGTVEVRIPEASQSGRKLRLRDRGIPGDPPGNLFLVLEVVVPPADTPKARELYETMARELAFNARNHLGV